MLEVSFEGTLAKWYYICSRCQETKAWHRNLGLVVCASCGYEVSVTVGTIFESTRKPLTIWFWANWWVTSQKTGTSALGLQRIIGLDSYYTAWTWFHKPRRAMVRTGRDHISDTVEVDEVLCWS